MRSKVFQRVLDNTPKDVEIFVDLYADLVVRINQLLQEKGISKKKLAENMDKHPSEISKWLNGEHNFTLRSLAKLSAELGEPLLEVPKEKPQTELEYNWIILFTNPMVGSSKFDPSPSDEDWKSLKITKSSNEFSYA